MIALLRLFGRILNPDVERAWERTRIAIDRWVRFIEQQIDWRKAEEALVRRLRGF